MSDTKRTKGIHIYTPVDGSDRVEILRHTVRDATGTLVELPGSEVRVSSPVAALASYAIPGAPVTITNLTDLRALLKAIADDLATKDEAARAAAHAQAQAEDNPPSA